MREIKFRAWNDETKGMIPDVQDELLIGAISSIPGLYLMQYTGLQDKNGVEIYEGDIVTVGRALGDIKQEKHVVTFDFDLLSYLLHIPETVITVIGNIYQNPELLK